MATRYKILHESGALGTPSAGTLTNCTFPTLNQNTTGTAANLSGTPNLGIGTLDCGAITSTGALALGVNTVACGDIANTGDLTTDGVNGDNFSKSVEITVANNATYVLSDNGLTYGMAFLYVYATGKGAFFYFYGAIGDPTEINDPTSYYSVTKDGAGDINIYRDAANSDKLTLQNKTGAERILRIFLVGA